MIMFMLDQQKKNLCVREYPLQNLIEDRCVIDFIPNMTSFMFDINSLILNYNPLHDFIWLRNILRVAYLEKDLNTLQELQ